MPTYYYYNTLNNKVSTTVTISFCRKVGPMSECGAFSIADQAGCKYRRPSTLHNRCMYHREDMGNACDNVYAQAGVAMPFPEVDQLLDSELNCTMCSKYDTCALRKDDDKSVCVPSQMRYEIGRTIREKKKE